MDWSRVADSPAMRGGIQGVVGSGAPAELLIPASEIAQRVEALGRELRERSRDSAEPPVLVGVLKGSTLFLADLVRALGIDAEVDFMESDIVGRDVLLVEDIVDTGLTLTYLRRSLSERGPRSLRTVALLDKAARRIVPVPVEYRGFEIPDVFVVGYGLDFMGRYRNVPDLYAVRDLARLANDPMLLVGPFFGPDGTART
jgi:hypoxanthine phosphoribosyltransferase